MKTALCLLTLAVVGCSSDSNRHAPTATITPQAVAAADLPAAQRLPGQLQEAWRWTDQRGENLLVVFRTETAPKPLTPRPADEAPDPEELERTARLTARQYVRPTGGRYTELWRLQDQVTNCPMDITLRLRRHSTLITDLDHNGQTETTLMYALACRSSVEAAELKLVLREGAAKYALRGYTTVQYDSVPAARRQPSQPCCLAALTEKELDEAETTGAHAGHYFSEADFKDKPEFLRFARRHWQQHSIETESDNE
jgi:hypothetical protein